MDQPVKFYSTGQVARFCQVSTTLVRNWCNRGLLPARRMPGGRGHQRRVRHDDLVAFMVDNGMEHLLKRVKPAAEPDTSRRVILTLGMCTADFDRLNNLLVSYGGRAEQAANFTDCGELLVSRDPHGVVMDFSAGREECMQAARSVRRAALDVRLIAVVNDDEFCHDIPAEEYFDAAVMRPINPGIICDRLKIAWREA